MTRDDEAKARDVLLRIASGRYVVSGGFSTGPLTRNKMISLARDACREMGWDYESLQDDEKSA